MNDSPMQEILRLACVTISELAAEELHVRVVLVILSVVQSLYFNYPVPRGVVSIFLQNSGIMKS